MKKEFKKYLVSLNGCDDETYIALELTDEQFRIIQKLSKMSEKSSGYSCQPTMSVEEYPNLEKYEKEIFDKLKTQRI